jgi:hypothetical protein
MKNFVQFSTNRVYLFAEARSGREEAFSLAPNGSWFDVRIDTVNLFIHPVCAHTLLSNFYCLSRKRAYTEQDDGGGRKIKREIYSTLTMKAWNHWYLSWSEIPHIDFLRQFASFIIRKWKHFVSVRVSFKRLSSAFQNFFCVRITAIIRLVKFIYRAFKHWIERLRSDCNTNLIFIPRSNSILIEIFQTAFRCASVCWIF